MAQRSIITDFTGGEVSDRLMARIDSPIYPKTCRKLENFIVHVSGGADFRPGTVYCGEIADKLVHGDCESEDAPHIRGDGSSLSNATFERSDSIVHEGEYSYEHIIDTGGSDSLALLCDNGSETDSHELIPGRTYELEAWIYVGDGIGPDLDEVALALAYYDAGDWITVEASPTVFDEWEKLTTGPVTIPSTATGAGASLIINGTADTGECVYWDNLKLRAIDENVRLIPFVSSTEQAYVLELTDKLIRVWKDGELVQSGGSDLEVTTPWAEADLFALKCAQAENALYFAHPDYQIRELQYLVDDSWVLLDTDVKTVLVVGNTHAADPLRLYSAHADLFEKMPDPETLPGSNAYKLDFSSDNKYLAVPSTGAPYVTVYKREKNTFIKLSDLPDCPTQVRGVAFSPNGLYLAVAAYDSPYLAWYKRDGDTFTKLDNPATVPTAYTYDCSWSPDNEYVAFVASSSPYVYIYQRTGDSLAKVDNPDVLPAGTGSGIAWAPDGKFLAVAHSGSPYITIYEHNDDTFNKIANPNTLPPDAAQGCVFSHDNAYLAVGFQTSSPYFYVYARTGEAVFTKIADPATKPTGTVTDCAFSPEGLYLAIAHANSPYITIYKIVGGVLTKVANPNVLPSGAGWGCCFSPPGWGDIPWGAQYPAALTFHEQRLVVGRGRKVWASRVGYPRSFSQDVSDNSFGYEYKFASEVLESIRWMVTKSTGSRHYIIIGTTYGEWLMSGGDQPITASNVYMGRVSAHGSANLAAVLANESILFVQKGGQRLREFMYTEERGGYVSPDLTLLADHIGIKGFADMAWQRSPRSMLWTIRDNGELAIITLDRNHDIQAWSRHPTDGTVESAAVIPGTDEDIVYMATKRTIDGDPKKYIEYLKPINRPDSEDDYFFVDCGKTFDYTATTDSIEGATQEEPVVITATGHPFANDEFVKITGVVGMTELNGNVYMVKNKAPNTFELYETDGTTPLDGTEFGEWTSGGTVQKVVKSLSGLTHLEGKSVTIYADGNKLANETVATGAITIDEYAAKIHVGLAYTGTLITQRFGRFSKTRMPEGVLLLYKTRGGKIGQDENHLKSIRYNEDAVVTKPQEVSISGEFSREGSVVIVQDQPYPMTLLGIVADMNTNG